MIVVQVNKTTPIALTSASMWIPVTWNSFNNTKLKTIMTNATIKINRELSTSSEIIGH